MEFGLIAGLLIQIEHRHLTKGISKPKNNWRERSYALYPVSKGSSKVGVVCVLLRREHESTPGPSGQEEMTSPTTIAIKAKEVWFTLRKPDGAGSSGKTYEKTSRRKE